ncbi:monocyte chemotactic protein 1B-like [Halichoeres trimaculatus]|uniref:monocyte chemotactic protein 1B-like n=1 Tax=Halichoeres trimaculatus TaxID=147232 RepID=UPI003D9DF4A8
MAPRLIAALLLLGVVCVEFSAAEVPIDCCLTTSSKRVPIQIIADHRIQEAGKGCDIGATVFETKKGVILCISHPSEEAWVRKTIRHLEKKAQQA